MQVGDLVKLSLRKTRKGMTYEKKKGVVTQIYSSKTPGFTFVKAFFDREYTFNMNDLVAVNEAR